MRRFAWVAALLAALLLAAACSTGGEEEGAPTTIPTLAPAESVTLVPEIQGGGSTIPASDGVSAEGEQMGALGAAIYERHCTPCHGVQGEGVDAPALRNNDYIQTSGQQDVANTIATGISGTEMPAWLHVNGGPLASSDINAVAAYLQTLQNVPDVPRTAPQEEPTEAPPPPNAPPARPSEPGDVGAAASLDGSADNGRELFGLYCAACHGPEGVQGIPNPGSDDGAVPELNPIDPTIANSDRQVFAENVDLFVEHGSVPEGPNPRLMMPPFGDTNMLTDQQIADAIAYVIQLNEQPESP